MLIKYSRFEMAYYTEDCTPMYIQIHVLSGNLMIFFDVKFGLELKQLHKH